MPDSKNEVSVRESFTAFENLLTTTQDVNESIVAAGDNSVALQVAKARGLLSLREAFTDAAMPAVMQLAGTAIGFRTDKDIDGGGTSYGPLVVRDVVLAALIDGVELLGNQMNIIAGRYYLTTEGCDHKLASIPYLTDLDIQVGNPEDTEISEAESSNGNYTVFSVYGFVPVVITCRVHGRTHTQSNIKTVELDGRIQVSASGKDKLKTVDSMKSKAEKRAKGRLIQFAQTASADLTDTEPPTTDAAPVTRKAESESTLDTEPPRVRDWAAEFEQHGVSHIATAIRDAKKKGTRGKIVSKAKEDENVSAEAFQVLKEYADSKNA